MAAVCRWSQVVQLPTMSPVWVAAEAGGRGSNDYGITMAEIVMAILMISCYRN